jgi:hypothetical protein
MKPTHYLYDMEGRVLLGTEKSRRPQYQLAPITAAEAQVIATPGGPLRRVEGVLVREATEVPVPVLDRLRFRHLVLRVFGLTAADVYAKIEAIAEPVARESARIDFEESPTFHHSHPLLLSLAAEFGITPARVDAAFREEAAALP